MKNEVSERLVLKDVLSTDLALRDSAERLFDMIEKQDSKELALDFSGVHSITRSFAHEYMLRKKTSPIVIKERNIPTNIRKMFALIKSAPRKNRMAMLKRVKAKPLKVNLSAYLF